MKTEEEKMIIRKAEIKDTKMIAAHMILAMKDIIYKFIGENSTRKASQFLESLICKKATQYSYENCWIMESKEGIVAVANVYNGAKLRELRLPVEDMIKSVYDRPFNPEDETQAGEFYIDCIGVSPDWQGKGLGSKMLKFLIDEYVYKRRKILGLLVDKENPNAKRLYLKLGFEFVGEKILVGKKMEHLQIKNYR